MDPEEVRKSVEKALRMVAENDQRLLENDLGERCIASRLAMYLQQGPEHSVDVEYNRDGVVPKMLDLPEDCANHRNEDGQALVVPDVIVHRRGHDGRNILVLELKKTTNPNRRGTRDREGVRAFRTQLRCSFGALIECETRQHHKPGIRLSEWVEE
jgi:hypothetical protein